MREAYGLPRATTFEDLTPDLTVQGLLEDAYGSVEILDAYTGALAESQDRDGLFAGPLLQVRYEQGVRTSWTGEGAGSGRNDWSTTRWLCM